MTSNSNSNSNERHADDDPASWDWVDPQALKTMSSIRILGNTLSPAKLLEPNIDPTTVSFLPCTKFDRVCFPRTQDGKQDFFYVYKVLFTELRLTLPFTDFQVQILNKINAAPSQLHPNGWIFVTSFELLCHSLVLVPTVRTFFYFFQSLVKSKGWVHIHARRKILELDQRTYNFKSRYFRVEGREGSVPFFMDENKKPKFPLHWSKSVRSPDSPAFPTLSECEQTLINKLRQLENPCSCAALINPDVVFSSDESSASGRRTDTDLNGIDETEEKEAEEVSSANSEEMKTKRKRVFTLGEAEQMTKKKQKVLVESSAPPPSRRKQNNIAHVEMEEHHLRGFEGEGRVASLWDRRFDVDRHVRDHLFFCSDQDRLRRTGHVEVARFVKAHALRIAAGAEFLEEQLELSRKEVSRLNSELAKERSARVKAEARLGEDKAGLKKAERELAVREAELARARKQSEYTEGCLLREWKKSVTESFQNAIEQVRLGFPDLNLDSILLDPFKVVEGELLVDPPSARR